MTHRATEYFERLFAGAGQGWTRFWFTPSDPSMLCFIRVLVGTLATYLHATLALDLIAFFGAGGLLAPADIAPLEGGTFSYLNYLGAPAELWTVHLLGLVVLVLFTFGIWTRLTAVLATVVFFADVNRAPMITGCTESIVAMTMLYLCLATCGRHYSVDERRAEAAQQREGRTLPLADELSTSATIATRLIQLNLVLLVAMMAFSQLSGEVWWLGTGMWWLIARAESHLVDFSGLYAWPKLIEFWTHAVVAFELCFATLVWVPLLRPLVLAVGVLIWTSLALATGDVTFSLALVIASLAFVSPEFTRHASVSQAVPVMAS